MFNRDRYWKCEYENLRRKNNKKINEMIRMASRFADKTYTLLKALGLTDEQIRRYYDDSK